MKFTIIAFVAGLAAASMAPGYSYGGDSPAPSSSIAAPAASSSPCDEESAPAKTPVHSPAPSSLAVAPKASETCEVYTETCTVTVTAPAKQPWIPSNSTAVAAVGTGTPASPTKAYYSNAANSVTGGAFVVGAGALAALFL